MNLSFRNPHHWLCSFQVEHWRVAPRFWALLWSGPDGKDKIRAVHRPLLLHFRMWAGNFYYFPNSYSKNLGFIFVLRGVMKKLKNKMKWKKKMKNAFFFAKKWANPITAKIRLFSWNVRVFANFYPKNSVLYSKFRILRANTMRNCQNWTRLSAKWRRLPEVSEIFFSIF